LPNLETKFVAANTLIGIKREQGIFADPKIEETQAKLLEIRHRYFNPRTVKEKDKLREKDIKLTRALLDLLKEDGFYNATDAAQMAEWNPYNQTKPSDFFDAWWMFGIKDGFDVVIGNPPYVDSEHMIIIDESLRDRYKGIYKSAIGNWDLFVIFIEKSILLANIYGVIVLITPNKLISQDYASVIRNMIIAGLLEIRDYSRLDVFENTAVYPITILIKKKDQNQPVNVISMSTVNSIKGANKIDRRELQILPWDVFFWDFSRLLILRKINNCSKSLGDLIKFENPCTVSEAYEIKEILLDKNLTNNAKKFINSGTIDPYLSWWSVKNTVYIRDKYKYPIVTDRGLKKISARRFMQAQSKKIIVANMTLKIEAFLDINAEYLAGKSTIIAVGNADELNIGVALLNSKLVSFWYKCMYHSTKMAGEALSITTKRLSKAPVPEISGDSKKSLLKYVKSLLNKKNKDSLIDTSALERQIDNLVYRLYNLTWEEVRVIEPEFPLSKAEYEGTQRINSTPMRYISMARQTKSIR
jgi:hypothetical protein